VKLKLVLISERTTNICYAIAYVGGIVPAMEEKGKHFVNRLLVPVIIVLVALAAFGLGRLSVLMDQKGELIIHTPEENL
jgi:hypothetical protein